MNYLFVTDANVQRGGICLFLLRWVSELRKIDKDGRIIIYFRKTIWDEEIVKRFYGINVEIVLGGLPEKGTSLEYSNRNKVKSDIKKILNEVKIDVFHIHSSALGFTVLALSEAKKARVPVRISHAHGRNSGNIIKKVYWSIFRIYIRKVATAYAGCSKDAGLYQFGKSGIMSSKWHYIQNVIDAKEYKFDKHFRNEYRRKLNLDEDDILIGATAMLTELKNHVFLIPIINEFKRKNINAYLIVLGEGEQRKNIIDKAKLFGVNDRVFLPGESNKINEWLCAMDYYVMPSLTEGLGISTIEAQANGLYCLLSDTIPREVALSSDVVFLPVFGEKAYCKWVEKIIQLKPKTNEQRYYGYDTVVKMGFDISNEVYLLAELYDLDV